jgi:hypothetical protein
MGPTRSGGQIARSVVEYATSHDAASARGGEAGASPAAVSSAADGAAVSRAVPASGSGSAQLIAVHAMSAGMKCLMRM